MIKISCPNPTLPGHHQSWVCSPSKNSVVTPLVQSMLCEVCTFQKLFTWE